MRLFHFEFMCDEKHLADVQWALAGKVSNLEVKPVKNAEMTKEGIKANGGALTIKEVVWNHIIKHKMIEVTSMQIRDVLKFNGFNPSSTHGAAINPLINDGFLKYGVKGSGIYRVNTAMEGK